MRYKLRPIRILVTFLILLISLFVPTARAKKDIPVEDCLSYHDTPDAEQFKSSVHGDNLCISCHNDISEIPHLESPAKVTCSECHVDEDKIYKSSGHGAAVKAGFGAAYCFDCHGDPHTILDSSNPKSPTSHQNIPNTCATCHEDTKKMAQFNLLQKSPSKTYFNTVHGKAITKDQSSLAAVCTDCHGSHNLYPSANSKSLVNRANIPRPLRPPSTP